MIEHAMFTVAREKEFEIEGASGLTASFQRVGRFMRVIRRADGMIQADEIYPAIERNVNDAVTALIEAHANGHEAFETAGDNLVMAALQEYRKESRRWKWLQRFRLWLAWKIVG